MRLGKHEKAILDYLEARGEHASFAEVVCALFHVDRRGDPRHWPEVPHSFDVAVRRAIRSLQRKGRVHCADGIEKHWAREEPYRCFCWLPQHEAPKARALVTGAQFGEAILSVLAEAPGGTMAYKELVTTVAGRLSATYGGGSTQILGFTVTTHGYVRPWARVAISRAVRRLAYSGRISAYVRPSGHVVSVELERPVGVAM